MNGCIRTHTHTYIPEVFQVYRPAQCLAMDLWMMSCALKLSHGNEAINAIRLGNFFNVRLRMSLSIVAGTSIAGWGGVCPRYWKPVC